MHKLFIRTIIVLSLLCHVSLSLSASNEAVSDGLIYELNPDDHTATLTGVSADFVVADLQIPQQIIVESNAYSVVSISVGAFKNVDCLETVVVPGSVVSVGNMAFELCANLLRVDINEGVKQLGTRTFYGCKKLASVILPSTLASIGENSFTRCDGLMDIYCAAVVPPVMSNNDFMPSSGTTIPAVAHVVKDSVDLYKSADGWQYLSTIIGDLNLAGEERVELSAIGAGTVTYGDNVAHDGITVVDMPAAPENIVVSIVADEGYEFRRLSVETASGETIHYSFTHERGKIEATAPYVNGMKFMAEFMPVEQHTLTVLSSHGGEYRVSVSHGNRYRMEYQAPDSWYLSSVSFDNEPLEVTPSDRGGVAVLTPPVVKDSRLSFVITNTMTGAEVINNASMPEVRVYSDSISITGLKQGDVVTVTDANGVNQSLQSVGDGVRAFNITPGVYIIRVGSSIYKVMI